LGTVVVAGALAAKPGNGGEAWVRLSWVLGLRRLGWDAWLLEQADAATAEGGRAFFEQETRRRGLGSRALLLTPEGVEGPLSRSELDELARGAALLVNISGNLRDPDLLERFRRRAYVDLDPGFTQFWHDQGQLGDQLEGYDRYFTVGLNLGAPDCRVPTGGIDWVPLPPPVLLDEWQSEPQRELDRFTTVATWRNAFGPPEVDGRSFTLKHHELRRFADLPRRAAARFEIALDIHPAEAVDLHNLRDHGWHVVEPRAVAADSDAFRAYVRGSGGELSVTQGVYAETRSGWISDRTAHYLASGRPAVVQETGIPDRYRAGAGMLTFSDMDGAIAAVERVTGSYGEHAAAARSFAEETFDSDRVLGQMLEAVAVE
jgi:hypothetical protein